MKKIEVFYPGYTKKAVTFSMDDGNIKYDAPMIDMLRPAGFLGTFNLTTTERLTAEEYRELYRGFEIANHCKCHPYAFDDNVDYVISDEPFDQESADPACLYRHGTIENFYYVKRPVGWRLITDPETYIDCIDRGQRELEAVFGEGSIRSFVWPFSEQNSRRVKEHLATLGYYGIRRTGLTRAETGFDFPEDMSAWQCNANHTNITEIMALYEDYPDDGRLKFFAFGVHAVDFLRDEHIGRFKEFVERYGNRPESFWYATVGDIVDYKRAIDALIITDTKLENPSGLTVFVKIDGIEYSLKPSEVLSIS